MKKLYFGGKSRVAAQIWQRFGKPENFVEPFFGSGAVLLGCPHPGHTETVNDADGLLANFWRAVTYDAEAVAAHCDFPVSEVDLHAWHRRLVDSREHVERMMADPKYYDVELAGRWCWGISQWIGTGWCPPAGEVRGRTKDGGLWQARPHLGGDKHEGMGVHKGSLARKMPHLQNGDGSEGSRGIHRVSLARKMPFIASPAADRKQYGLGIHGKRLSQQGPRLSPYYDMDGSQGTIKYANNGALYDYFRAIQARLRRTRVVCGDFARILGPSVTWRHGMTAVFLDPPYADGEHAVTYAGGGQVWERVTRWCEENGEHPLLRIALCGYAGTWQAPAGWTSLAWRTPGGYGAQGNGRGRENAARECIWFNKSCIDPSSDWSGTLFEEID